MSTWLAAVIGITTGWCAHSFYDLVRFKRALREWMVHMAKAQELLEAQRKAMSEEKEDA